MLVQVTMFLVTFTQGSLAVSGRCETFLGWMQVWRSQFQPMMKCTRLKSMLSSTRESCMWEMQPRRCSTAFPSKWVAHTRVCRGLPRSHVFQASRGCRWGQWGWFCTASWRWVGCQWSSVGVSGRQRSSAVVSGRLGYFWICTIKNASNVYINLYSYTLNFHTNSIQNCYYYGRSGIYDSSQCASSLLSGP